jgi:hypothetical protein
MAQSRKSPNAKAQTTKIQSNAIRKECAKKQAEQKQQATQKRTSLTKQKQEKSNSLPKSAQQETAVSSKPPLTTHKVDIVPSRTPGANSTDTNNNTIAHTLQQKWCPPKDIIQRTMCVIKIRIGQGTLSSIPQVIESSGTPAFDAQARLFLQQMTYPLSVWHSELIIRFL